MPDILLQICQPKQQCDIQQNQINFRSKRMKKRAISAKNNQNNTQLITNTSLGKHRSHSRRAEKNYTEPNENDSNIKINKFGKTRMHTSFMDQIQRILPLTGIKEPQQLQQQNMLLKNELNNLNKRLNLQRGKIENQKKKNQLYTKQLSRQFQKQVYWSNGQNNSYLITGIKHQYQKIKQLYQKKCEQCNFLRSNTQTSQLQQLNLYCQSLQTQNKILIQNICFLKKKASINNYLQRSTSSDQQMLILKRRLQHILDQNKIIQLKLTQNQRIIKEKQKKLNFLQKLIIQKQNNEYNSRKKVKYLEKEKKNLQFNIVNKNQQIQSLKNDYEQQINQNKLLHQKKFEIQRNIFEKTIKQKNIHIQKLQKQVGYLSTLLSYWKPLDQLDRQNSKDVKSVQQNLSTSNDKFPLSRSRTPLNPMLQQHQFSQQQNFLQNSQKNNQNNMYDIQGDIIRTKTVQVPEQNLQRKPKSSNKKWSVQAKKCRKVQALQVSQIGEQLKYRLIGHQVSIQMAKKYFNCPQQLKSKFDIEYISMKQVKSVLMQFPFNLKQQQAHLLSRYMIQDSLQQYVYCDMKNQLSRSILKSILKTVIGQYSLPNKQFCQTKWKAIKKQYSYNMQLALKSICPKGLITHFKLLQLIKSLGIQTTDQIDNFIIGKLIKQAESLQTLKYQNLFDPDEKIQ